MEVGGPVTVTDVQVQFDFQANSSMTITISGTKPVDFYLRLHDLSLDVQGDFSPALPFGTCAARGQGAMLLAGRKLSGLRTPADLRSRPDDAHVC